MRMITSLSFTHTHTHMYTLAHTHKLTHSTHSFSNSHTQKCHPRISQFRFHLLGVFALDIAIVFVLDRGFRWLLGSRARPRVNKSGSGA